MRKLKIVLIFAVAIVMLLGVISVSAQLPDGGGWWANYTIQNTSGGDAEFTSTAYHLSGGAATTYQNTIEVPDANSVIFHPGLAANCTDPVTVSGCRIGLSPDLPDDFAGSVVINSDAAAVAVVNFNNNQSGDVGDENGAARSAYQGFGGASTGETLFFPTVKNDFVGQSTLYYVQAAGAGATVTMTYNMNDGGVYNDSQPIEANRTYVFMPSAAGVPSCNGGNGGGGNVANCFGGATLTADSAVAGTVIEYEVGVGTATFVLATRGLTDDDAGTSQAASAMKSSFNGGTTGATILNTGETTSTVNLDFSVTNISSSGLNADGDPCGNSIGDPASDEVSIGPGSSVVVNAQQDNIGGLDSCTFFAMTASISGTVTSDGHIGIVLTVNENRTYQGETVKAVYAGANTATSANTVFVPLYKEDFNGNTTGATVVNVGTSPAFITGTFTADDGSIYTLVTADEIDPGSAAAFFRPGSTNADNFTSTPEDLPDGEKYSVVFNSSQPIEALVQESDRNFDNGILDISNYEGFKN